MRRDCTLYLRTLPPDQRTAAVFCHWFSEDYYVQRFGMKRSTMLCESTARVWFEKLGWYMWEKKKGLYYDGHEREDVVKYRNRFVEALQPYQVRMETYSGDNMETVHPPVLQPGQKRVVMVVQDESIFHANDGRARVLVEKGHEPIQAKGEGASKMVSGFCCPCHGPLALTPDLAAIHPEVAKNAPSIPNCFPSGHAFVSIDVGKRYGDDGYWTSEHLAKQLVERAIPIFNLLHPGCEGLWLFDNSQNHLALAPDALRASRLNLSDGGMNTPMLRSGRYINSHGERVSQVMQRADGVQKGLRTILMERGLWAEGGLRLHEARQLLAAQPDFDEQRGLLVELIVTAGHSVLMFPKFHCEFNFIENLWGRMKVYLRRNCQYSFAALQVSLVNALTSVSLTVTRRYAQRCDRFFDAYRLKDAGLRLTPQQVARAVKQYKSHRTIPNNIAMLFPSVVA